MSDPYRLSISLFASTKLSNCIKIKVSHFKDPLFTKPLRAQWQMGPFTRWLEWELVFGQIFTGKMAFRSLGLGITKQMKLGMGFGNLGKQLAGKWDLGTIWAEKM